jgi:hypothetical protein
MTLPGILLIFIIFLIFLLTQAKAEEPKVWVKKNYNRVVKF